MLLWGRRSGKSELASHIVAKYLSMPNKTVWIVAPIASDAEEIYAPKLYEIFKMYGWGESGRLIDGATYEITDRGCLYKFKNGSQLFLKSAERLRKQKGRGVDLIILDEFCEHYKKEEWEEIYIPSLNPAGRLLIISTPQGYDTFYNLYQKGLHDKTGLWKSYFATSFVNDKYKEIDPLTGKTITISEKIKMDSMFMSPEKYRQEYLCEFGAVTGKVAHDFNRNLHSVKLPEYFSDFELCIGMDFNHDPNCWVIFQIVPKTFLEENYPEFKKYKAIENGVEKEKERTFQEKVVCYLKAFKEPNTPTEKMRLVLYDYLDKIKYSGIKYFYGDANIKSRTGVTNDTHLSLIQEIFPLNEENKFKYNTYNPSVVARIHTTNSKILNVQNEIGILLDIDRCEELAKDFETATKDKNGEIDKRKYDPHLFDAATYPIMKEFSIIRKKENKKTYEIDLSYLLNDNNDIQKIEQEMFSYNSF